MCTSLRDDSLINSQLKVVAKSRDQFLVSIKRELIVQQMWLYVQSIAGPPSLATMSDQSGSSERPPSSTVKHLSTQTPSQHVGNRSSTNSSDHTDRRHGQASRAGSNSSLNHKAIHIESSRNSLDSQSSNSNSEDMKDEPLTFFTAAKFR